MVYELKAMDEFMQDEILQKMFMLFKRTHEVSSYDTWHDMDTELCMQISGFQKHFISELYNDL